MSGFTVSPNLQAVYAALVPFIMGVTGLAASNVVQGLPNRASMPTPGFVSIQGTVRGRLRTNQHDWESDDLFSGTGSVTNGSPTLTVATVASGVLAVGQQVIMAGVTPGTTIQALGTGTGGVGTYTLSAPATANEASTSVVVGPASQSIEEGVQLRVQIDCYGPQSTAEIQGAEDWATMLSTTLRDAYGVDALSPSGVWPLHADEAHLAPLEDGEDQYEERWMLEAFFQYNPVTSVPQQYADAVKLTLVNVQEAYPA